MSHVPTSIDDRSASLPNALDAAPRSAPCRNGNTASEALVAMLSEWLRTCFEHYPRGLPTPPAAEGRGARVQLVHLSIDQTAASRSPMATVEGDHSMTWEQLLAAGYPSFNAGWTIGVPALYVVTDRESRQMVGFHYTMDKPNWRAALEALQTIGSSWMSRKASEAQA